MVSWETIRGSRPSAPRISCAEVMLMTGLLLVLEDDVRRALLLADDQPGGVPVAVGAVGEDAGHGGPGDEQHGEGRAADDAAAGPRRLDLAPARGARDEGGDEASAGEGVRLDQVALGGHALALSR